MIKGDAIWERLKERNESKVNKSVYSLVLADDVVEAIDRLAYSMNTSRSITIIFYLKEFYAVNAVQHINVLAVKTLYFGHAGPIITKQAIVPMDESPISKFMQHL